MLLTLAIISQLIVLTFANPFQKYPFVFLLDIGNEEIENAKTEQIRVTVPGGSIALRYPAVGDGDTIAHVRVTGIDFGTDLKANIYDGGPGYKYVVLAFAGNPGVAYDAVVSLQTIASDNLIEKKSGNQNLNTNARDDSDYQVNEIDEANNSAEDTSEDRGQPNDDQTNEKLTLAGSSYYNEGNQYEDLDNGHRNGDKEEVSNDYDNISSDTDSSDETDRDRMEVQTYKENFQTESHRLEYQDSLNGPKVEKYTSNMDYVKEDPSNEPVRIVDSNLYNKYEALRPHLYTDVKIYPSETSLQDEVRESKNGDGDDTAEMDQMFNDEEVHNGQRFKNANVNRNYYYTDDPSAVPS